MDTPISKIYTYSQGFGNGTRTYYFETTRDGANFILRVFCVETNTCWIGTVSPPSISQNPQLTVEGVFKMLSNALVNRPLYLIVFFLDSNYIQLRFTAEIFETIQDINLDTNVDEALKTRYSMLLLQNENNRLKEKLGTASADIERLKERLGTTDAVIERMKEQIEELERRFERLGSNHSNGSNTNLTGVFPIPNPNSIPIRLNPNIPTVVTYGQGVNIPRAGPIPHSIPSCLPTQHLSGSGSGHIPAYGLGTTESSSAHRAESSGSSDPADLRHVFIMPAFGFVPGFGSSGNKVIVNNNVNYMY